MSNPILVLCPLLHVENKLHILPPHLALHTVGYLDHKLFHLKFFIYTAKFSTYNVDKWKFSQLQVPINYSQYIRHYQNLENIQFGRRKWYLVGLSYIFLNKWDFHVLIGHWYFYFLFLVIIHLPIFKNRNHGFSIFLSVMYVVIFFLLSLFFLLSIIFLP